MVNNNNNHNNKHHGYSIDYIKGSLEMKSRVMEQVEPIETALFLWGGFPHDIFEVRNSESTQLRSNTLGCPPKWEIYSYLKWKSFRNHPCSGDYVI